MKYRFLFSIGVLFSLLMGGGLAQAQQIDATLELRSSTSQVAMGEEFDVAVLLNNPSQQDVISVRSWLKYDPQQLQGISIDTEGSAFGLAAPGENEFSETDGLVKIGRSNISGGFSEAQTTVAIVRFKVIGQGAGRVSITPYNFQTSELGHTSVNIISGGFPVNILSAEPASLVVNVGPAQVVTPEPVSQLANLMRPQNLKINTGSGYVDLKWDRGTEEDLEGYFIYYGPNSGVYTRRRQIGLTDMYRMEGLNNGQAYYFALTAVDDQGRESDYSDEVAVIVNEPLSLTAPFENNGDLLLASVPEQPQNGPLVWWLGLVALAMGAGLTLRPRRKLAPLN